MIEVLDHGSVRLVDHMGSDLSIVRAARQSYDAAWRAGEDQGSDARLIRYLWRHRHSTPFEVVTFTFAIEAPIFVLRQWMRHRTWTFNEASGRYIELPERFYVPRPEHVGAATNDNKQGRNMLAGAPTADRIVETEIVRAHSRDAFARYRELRAAGWPTELARIVLPLNTYTRMQGTVDLWNLLHFIDLRVAPNSQYEIRVYAEALRKLVAALVPVTMAACEEAA